jgi:hypothetical protein
MGSCTSRSAAEASAQDATASSTHDDKHGPIKLKQLRPHVHRGVVPRHEEESQWWAWSPAGTATTAATQDDAWTTDHHHDWFGTAASSPAFEAPNLESCWEQAFEEEEEVRSHDDEDEDDDDDVLAAPNADPLTTPVWSTLHLPCSTVAEGEEDPTAPSDEEEEEEPLVPPPFTPLTGRSSRHRRPHHDGPLSSVKLRHHRTVSPRSIRNHGAMTPKSSDHVVVPPTTLPRTQYLAQVAQHGQAIQPQHWMQYSKIQLQVAVQAKQDREQRLVSKIQQRQEDVQSYRQLWNDYTKLRHEAQQYQPQLETADDESLEEMPSIDGEMAVCARDCSARVDWKQSQTWYFDFESMDFGAPSADSAWQPPPNDDDDSQAGLSLLSEHSLEQQRLYYAQKRAQRKSSSTRSLDGKSRQRHGIGARSAASLDGSCTSSRRRDYGPVRSNASLRSGHNDHHHQGTLTNLEVAFSPESMRGGHGDDEADVDDCMSDLDDSSVVSDGYGPLRGRRRRDDDYGGRRRHSFRFSMDDVPSFDELVQQAAAELDRSELLEPSFEEMVQHAAAELDRQDRSLMEPSFEEMVQAAAAELDRLDRSLMEPSFEMVPAAERKAAPEWGVSLVTNRHSPTSVALPEPNEQKAEAVPQTDQEPVVSEPMQSLGTFHETSSVATTSDNAFASDPATQQDQELVDVPSCETVVGPVTTIEEIALIETPESNQGTKMNHPRALQEDEESSVDSDNSEYHRLTLPVSLCVQERPTERPVLHASLTSEDSFWKLLPDSPRRAGESATLIPTSPTAAAGTPDAGPSSSPSMFASSLDDESEASFSEWEPSSEGAAWPQRPKEDEEDTGLAVIHLAEHVKSEVVQLLDRMRSSNEVAESR